MKLAAKFLTPESIAFALVWLATAGYFRERGFYDPGALWHPVVGERILTDGFMTTDVWSYTKFGETWIPQQWGAEVILALLARLGGRDAQLVAFSTVVAGLFAWLMLRLRRAGLHWLLAGALTAACVVAASFHFFVRPHMASIVLMTAWAAVLVEVDRGRRPLAYLWLLVPLAAAWTNLHGGVLGGIVTLGAVSAGWLALFAWRGDNGRGPVRSWRGAGTVAAVGVACLAAPLANPFGVQMLDTWSRIVSSTVLPKLVDEHKPLNLAHGPDQVVAALGVVYLAVLVSAPLRQLRVTWLIPVMWLILSVKGIRQGPLFAVTAGVLVADIWPHTAWKRWLVRYGDSLAYGEVPGRQSWAALALPILLVGAALGCGRVGWARLDPDIVPCDITDAIKAELARTPNARLWNDCNLGGYCLAELPGAPVSMDDRFELYGDGYTLHYAETALKCPERIEGEASRLGVTHVLLAVRPEPHEPSALAKYLDSAPGWECAARGAGARLWRRK